MVIGRIIRKTTNAGPPISLYIHVHVQRQSGLCGGVRLSSEHSGYLTGLSNLGQSQCHLVLPAEGGWEAAGIGRAEG